MESLCVNVTAPVEPIDNTDESDDNFMFPSTVTPLLECGANVIPPAIEVKAIALSLVPAVFNTLIVWPVPAVACNLIASATLPSADISTPPALASILMAAADVPCVFVIVILSLVPVLAVNAILPDSSAFEIRTFVVFVFPI